MAYPWAAIASLVTEPQVGDYATDVSWFRQSSGEGQRDYLVLALLDINARYSRLERPDP